MTTQKTLLTGEEESLTVAGATRLANKLLRRTWTVSARGEKWEINLKDTGWRFAFNNRKRAVGLCSPRRKTIYLSSYFFNANKDKAQEWEDTIRHEIAHALDFFIRNTSDHSYEWKSIASQVGARPMSCTDKVKSDLTTSKYLLICDNCGKMTPSHKRKTRVAACGSCCRTYNRGRYSDKFQLRQVANRPSLHTAPVAEPKPAKKVETKPAAGTKKCSCCGQVKPLSEYSKSGSKSGDGLRARCKPCHKTWRAERIKALAKERGA